MNHDIAGKGSDFIEHYGVLGMKWGVRRTQAELDRAAGRTTRAVKDRTGKTIYKSKTTGKYRNTRGVGRDEDAVRARTIETKARASGTDSVSTKDLQDLVNRLRLEQSYDQLTKGKGLTKKQKGKRFLTGLVVDTGKDIATTQAKFVSETAKKAANEYLTKQIADALKKK